MPAAVVFSVDISLESMCVTLDSKTRLCRNVLLEDDICSFVCSCFTYGKCYTACTLVGSEIRLCEKKETEGKGSKRSKEKWCNFLLSNKLQPFVLSFILRRQRGQFGGERLPYWWSWNGQRSSFCAQIRCPSCWLWSQTGSWLKKSLRQKGKIAWL